MLLLLQVFDLTMARCERSSGSVNPATGLCGWVAPNNLHAQRSHSLGTITSCSCPTLGVLNTAKSLKGVLTANTCQTKKTEQEFNQGTARLAGRFVSSPLQGRQTWLKLFPNLVPCMVAPFTPFRSQSAHPCGQYC